MASGGRRLPIAAHTSRPWRIHAIAPDFTVEDVWALPTPGGPDDLPRLVAQMTSGGGFPAEAPLPVRFLWEARWWVGRRLGWDEGGTGLGTRVTSLRDRLPDDLRAAPTGPAFATVPFEPLYLLEDEWAAEMANRTVHAVMHIGWVADGAGGHHGQMAVLVRPAGRLGAAYMAAIKPFRHFLVYPALLRHIGRGWEAGRAPA